MCRGNPIHAHANPAGGLKGFPTYLGERTGLKVFTVPDPELCAVKGLQKIILDKEYYKKLSYSMLDQNYRWLR